MATATEAMSFETHRAPWWLGVMGGAFNILLGFLLFTVPVKTVLALVLALGYYWIFTGALTMVSMFVDRTAWGWKLFSGALSILAGVYVLRFPLIGAVAIPAMVILFLGIQSMIVGAVAIVMAFRGGGFLSAVMGVLSLIFGGILMANFANLATVASLVWVVAFMSLIGGVIQIFQAFRQRSE